MANEKRLIDANELKNHINKVSTHWLNDWSTLGVLAAVDKQPTVDAVEVVHGRWVMTLYTTTSKRGRVIANKKFACSVCGYGNGRKQSNYCPNCGAKMDGDGNE